MIRRVGAYGKLLANYASDDGIIAAGEAAELLYCRAIAFLSTSDTDGFISDGQLERFVGAGLKNVQKRADALVREHLWLREDGGYQVRSWVKINETAEERGRKLRSDRERKRKQHPTGFQPEEEPDSERNPSGIRNTSAPESPNYTVLTLGDQLGSPVQSSQVHELRSDKPSEPDLFDDFWTAYPRRVAKQAARRRWDTLVKRGVDPADILAGARAYADQIRRDRTEPQFVKQPDGWLLSGRWEDEQPQSVDPRPSSPWAGA